MTKNYDVAITLLEEGYTPIPIKKDSKICAVTWKDYQDREPTREELKQWFLNTTNEIAVIPKHFMVVDIDKGKNGEADGFETLKKEKLLLPKTSVRETPSKGFHVLIQPDKRIDQKQGILPSIDIRTNAGYIKWWDWNDGYKWIKNEEIKPYFHPKLVDGNDRNRVPYDSNTEPDSAITKVREGERHSSIFKQLTRLKKGGVDREVAEAVIKAWNLKYCEPPEEEQELMVQLQDIYNNSKYVDDRPIIPKSISKVNAEKGEYLMEGYIPKNAVGIFAGEGGIGKSFLTIYLAQMFGMGAGTLPNGQRINRKHNVMIFAQEDGEGVMAWRMAKMGMLPKNVFIDDTDYDFFNEQDLERLRALLNDPPKEILDDMVGDKKFDLVIFDPITSYSGDVETNSASKVGAFLKGFSELAQRDKCNTSIVGVTHMNKNTDASGKNRIMGSSAWRNKPRNVILFGDKDGYVYTQCDKANWTNKHTVPKLKYKINEDLTVSFHDDIPEDFDIDELLQESSAPNKKGQAKQVIIEMLSDGEVNGKDLEVTVMDEGFTKSTVQEARSELKKEGKISSKKDGHTNKQMWSLVEEEVITINEDIEIDSVAERTRL